MPEKLKRKRPKVLFIYDHPKPEWCQDGLSAALDVLEEDFEIVKHNIQTDTGFVTGEQTLLPNNSVCDFILAWGAFGSRPDQATRFVDVPKGLCVAGNATEPKGAENYSILFAESDWIIENYLPKHKNIVRAFGTNTDIFSPSPIPTPVIWDYIGVGAFASWKRWEKMIDKKGNRLVIGEYQKDNELESLEIVRTLVRNGVMVADSVSPLDLVNYYYYSRTLYQPADINGGGERSILEAQACGLTVEIEDDNPKLEELMRNKPSSHYDYAKKLKKGIESVL